MLEYSFVSNSEYDAEPGNVSPRIREINRDLHLSIAVSSGGGKDGKNRTANESGPVRSHFCTLQDFSSAIGDRKNPRLA